MRAAFVRALLSLAERDSRIMLLTGDLGFMALEPFAERFPDRFYNVGVAEQNMIGLATGLAEAGFIPFVYSIVTFATLRPYEFIRNGPILHQLPVRIAGMGGGYEYGAAGPTHHGLEDVAVMRTQPGIRIIAPADADQAYAAVHATWNLSGPVYYRLGKNDRITIPGLLGRFELGRVQIVREGGDLLMLTLGAITVEAVAAADQLAELGVHSTVAVVASVNPPPVDDLVRLLERFSTVFTIEAHYVNGGLGSLIAEVIAEHGSGARLVRCGVRNMPDGQAGSQNHFHAQAGISSQMLVERAVAELSLKKTL